MVEHSFDIGQGVYQFAPPSNKKIERNPFWRHELAKQIMETQGLSEAEAYEYVGIE